jgi:hypothetical protein
MAESFKAAGMSSAGGDDDVPDLVENFDESQ